MGMGKKDTFFNSSRKSVFIGSTIFSMLFLFFNMYYFMPQASESVESSSVEIENSIDVEN